MGRGPGEADQGEARFAAAARTSWDGRNGAARLIEGYYRERGQTMRRPSSRVSGFTIRAFVRTAVVMGWAAVLPGCGGANPGDPCTEHHQAETRRCVVADLSCAPPDACPASWSLAQSGTACSSAENGIKLAACGAQRIREVSYGSPPLFATCYYDAATGQLQGFLRQSDVGQYCGGASDLAYGMVSPSCPTDPAAMSIPCR